MSILWTLFLKLIILIAVESKFENLCILVIFWKTYQNCQVLTVGLAILVCDSIAPGKANSFSALCCCYGFSRGSAISSIWFSSTWFSVTLYSTCSCSLFLLSHSLVFLSISEAKGTTGRRALCIHLPAQLKQRKIKNNKNK